MSVNADGRRDEETEGMESSPFCRLGKKWIVSSAAQEG
jgi:hypothetical protein